MRHASVLDVCVNYLLYCPCHGPAIKSESQWRYLWFNKNLDYSVDEFKLLRRAGSKEGIDTLPDVSWILLAFKKQQEIRWESQSSCHRHDRVEARHFFPTLDVAPKIAGDVASFSRFLKAQSCCFPEPPDPLRKQDSMLRASHEHNDSG
jgi:hypothetical protein